MVFKTFIGQIYKQVSIIQIYFNKMNTFFKRLLLIIENQGFKNLNDFALNGLQYDSSSKLNRLKDEKKKPSVEILEDISNKFQTIDLHWLLTGQGEMLRTGAIGSSNPELEQENKALKAENNELKTKLIAAYEKLGVNDDFKSKAC